MDNIMMVEDDYQKVTAILVDDNIEFRERFKTYLLNRKELEIIGEASDGNQAVISAINLKPKLILMDISMPHKNGLQAMKEILLEQPNIKVVFVTIHSNHEYMKQTIGMGAAGYMLKKNFVKEFGNMLKTVLEGKTYISPQLKN